MDTIHTLTKKKTITNRVLVALTAPLVVLIGYDLFVRSDYVFLVVEVMMLGAAIDYLWRNAIAFGSISFGADFIELSRKGKTATVAYGSIKSLREIKNGFVAIVCGEKERYVVHAEHSRSMPQDAAARTANLIRDGVRERTGEDVPVRYV